MLNKSSIAICLLLIGASVFLGFDRFQTCNPINRQQLKEMLTQLGYEPKTLVADAGKEKFEVSITREGLDIPIGCEISANEKFVWLTVNLGPCQPENAARNIALLKQNAKSQPSHFYVTEAGKQMMGLPVENKGVTNANLRERLESIATKVGESKALWQ
jgi:hypothetical protein